VVPGEVAYWPDGHCIALGFGRTPISQGDETRLASPCNIFAKAVGDVKVLAQIKAGTRISVSASTDAGLVVPGRWCDTMVPWGGRFGALQGLDKNLDRYDPKGFYRTERARAAAF